MDQETAEELMRDAVKKRIDRLHHEMGCEMMGIDPDININDPYGFHGVTIDMSVKRKLNDGS